MFDQELYDKFDAPAKQKLLKILQQRGHALVGDITDEHYKDTDIITEKNNEQFKWEIQVRSLEHFTKLRNKIYNTFFVHTRKSQNTSDYYVLFPEDYQEMAFVKMSDVKSSPIKTVRTREGSYESFYIVPIQRVAFYIIQADNTLSKI